MIRRWRICWYVDSQLSIREGRYDDGSLRAEELQEFVSRIDSPGLNALCSAANGLWLPLPVPARASPNSMRR